MLQLTMCQAFPNSDAKAVSIASAPIARTAPIPWVMLLASSSLGLYLGIFILSEAVLKMGFFILSLDLRFA